MAVTPSMRTLLSWLGLAMRGSQAEYVGLCRDATRLEVHIWTRPRCQGGCTFKNTLRDRCSHISGLLVKTSHGLRALMKSALPRLITTAASGALSLRRLGGSWSDRSCHQLDYTSHCAERLLHVPVKENTRYYA